MPEHKDTIASEVLSSSIGGAISASILYPLEVLKTKMQTDESEEEKGMVEYAKELYRKEGVTVYFNGIETSACQSAIEKAFYFFSYTVLKQVHEIVQGIARPPSSAGAKPMGTLTNLALGCLAEWAHLPITMPIDCLTTAIQTSKKQNAMALMMTILKDGNMYKGIQAYYVLCFKPALQYTVFEQVKASLLKSRKEKSLSAAEAFLLGMVARTVATVAVFPFVRAKVVMQTRKKQGNEEGAGKDHSVTELLREMYQSGGLGALYQGLGPELTRGVFSAALMLMIKEKINGGVKNALYGPPSTSRRLRK